MSRRSELLRLLADGEMHSGEELAAALSVSRAAVWKRLQQLGDWGIALEARAGRRLPTRVAARPAGRVADPRAAAAGLCGAPAESRSARGTRIDERSPARGRRSAAGTFRCLPGGVPERRPGPARQAMGRALRFGALPVGQLEHSRCARDLRRAVARRGRRRAARAAPARIRGSCAEMAERHRPSRRQARRNTHRSPRRGCRTRLFRRRCRNQPAAAAGHAGRSSRRGRGRDRSRLARHATRAQCRWRRP